MRALISRLGLASAASLVFSFLSPVFFSPTEPAEALERRYEISEDYASNFPSYINVITQNGNIGSSTYCLVMSGADCDPKFLEGRNQGIYAKPGNKFVDFNLVMPACESLKQDFCIESVFSQEASKSEAVFVRYVDDNRTEAFPELGIPSGGSASIWRLNGSTKAGTEVLVRSWARFHKPQDSFAVVESSVLITPFETQQSPQFRKTGFTASSSSGVYAFQAPQQGCLFETENVCGVAKSFADSMELGLRIRTKNPYYEFFEARLTDPQVVFENVDGFFVYEVQGRPAVVPKIAVNFTDSYLSGKSVDPYIRNGGSFYPHYPMAFSGIKTFRELARDKAVGSTSIWRFGSTGYANGHPCYVGKGFVGLVATNASAYQNRPPKYSSGFFNYKVAGFHYLASGELALGSYYMVLNKEILRCQYGLSATPASVQVAVVGENGEEEVATTVVGEFNGQLRIEAHGFTFSEKEIRVKIQKPNSKTLSSFAGTSTVLTTKQKQEISATVVKAKADTKFICTGIRLEGQPQALNTLVRKRAKLACDYAKSLNPKLSTFYQTKTTKAPSYNGKVLVVSK